MASVEIKCIPGLASVRFFASRDTAPGNGWIHGGTVRRRCVTIAGLTLGTLSKPRTPGDPAAWTGSRRASFERARERARLSEGAQRVVREGPVRPGAA